MSEETGVSGMAGRRKGMGIEQAVKETGKEQSENRKGKEQAGI